MIAAQLIVKPMLPGDNASPNDLAAKINELIDAHNALVRHTFDSGTQIVLGSKIDGEPSLRNFIGMPTRLGPPVGTTIETTGYRLPSDEVIYQMYSRQPTAKAWQAQRNADVKACHALLIAWGKVCNHVGNKVIEVSPGIIKCDLCGLPYIPTGDGDL